MSCDECQQLFKQGFKKEFPCGDCPQLTPLSSEALHAWEIFKRSASRHTVSKTADKSEHDVFEIDWHLAVWLINCGDFDAKETGDYLIDLLHGLNAG